eukprot:CAMPEP_0113877672 /NCGR_PEP_ID=MMETSP0780_2-20120614/6232_1 /TAXON_ID=652834 /ORGANISM="Palpitomonas bilix" /LENGTH=59 /DNA_ID=CAMNT_0000864007 /DNA_START=53 /DNA_END=229 /DNA_ORIENTATION=+ /assembly_acc=CAM_ASM_000599
MRFLSFAAAAIVVCLCADLVLVAASAASTFSASPSGGRGAVEVLAHAIPRGFSKKFLEA